MIINFLKKLNKHLDKNKNELSSKNSKQDKNAIVKLPSNNRLFKYQISDNDFNNQIIAYFKNGILYDVSPKNKNLTSSELLTNANSARFFVSDGRKYDLYNPKDLIDFKIPIFEDNGKSFVNVPYNIDYILKKKAQNIYNNDLAIPTIFTTVNLMLVSTIGWQPKDYYRLISQLERLEENYYASYLIDGINKYNPSILNIELQKARNAIDTLEKAHSFGTDLVLLPYLACTCEECAKYQGRVYSISGKDKRYPKLPNIIKQTGVVHPGCHHALQVFYKWEHEILKYEYLQDGRVEAKNVDSITNSNRPFVDDRTNQEKEMYLRRKQKELKSRQYLSDEEKAKRYSKRAIEYDWITENLPQLAPKSLGGYTKMKHSNSKNYQRIKKEANLKGMILDDNI